MVDSRLITGMTHLGGGYAAGTGPNIPGTIRFRAAGGAPTGYTYGATLATHLSRPSIQQHFQTGEFENFQPFTGQKPDWVSQVDWNSIQQAAATAGCEFLPADWQKSLCRQILGLWGNGGGPDVPGTTCNPPLVLDPVTQICMAPGSPADTSDPGGGIPWVPVAGRYGVAESPLTHQQLHRTCRDGMVLGKDDYCYHPQTLHRWERKWRKPPRPVLTSGEVSAISKASRAIGRLKTQKKKMKRMAATLRTL